MRWLQQLISYVKKNSTETDIWQVAFRLKEKEPLYKGNTKNFVLIKNSFRYWRADPFLFKYNNQNYLFVEMYDRKKKKGVIGVAKLSNGNCSSFKVCLDLPFHLSYPCIFEKDGIIYMIPECYESGEVRLYRCTKFPMKWEYCRTLQNRASVDTTPYFSEMGNISYYFSSLYNSEFDGNDNLYIFDEHNNTSVVFHNNRCCRSAGHFIRDRIIIRPSQYDLTGYGDALIFNEVLNDDPLKYYEREYLKILPPDGVNKIGQRAVELIEKESNINYIGIHTYNMNEDYEMIDLKIEKNFSLYVLWENKGKIIRKVLRKMKRF